MAQLRHFRTELEARKTQIALISFGTSELTQAWVAETNASFHVLLDPERRAYQAFGLDQSMRRSWGIKVWLEYTRLMAKGRKWRGIQGDSSQLGGDFIVDRDGIIQMAYRSHDPTDRPAVSYILEKLEDINGYHLDEAKRIIIDK